MTQNTSRAVTNYRWLVFILVLGFWLDLFYTTDRTLFGWQFRYLTDWGLTANLIVAWLMLRYSLGRSDRTYNAFVSASAVLGAIVVFMYWKLYFDDPALVNGDHIMPWYQEYYVHGITQILMLFDAFFILGAFRQVGKTLATAMVIFISYIAWTEFVVRPLNDLPAGGATSGLAYPFLNDMVLSGRLVFYAATIATAIVLLGIGVLAARVLGNFRARTSQTAR